MSDLTLLSLSFHDSFGPVLESIIGPLSFSDTDQACVRSAAFPESAVSLSFSPHIYSFIVSSYYCHCVYLCRPANDTPRGCRLISLVIATETGFLQPVFDLLKSIRSILSHTCDDINVLARSLVKIWSTILYTGGKSWELPFFDGLHHYTSPLSAMPHTKRFISLNSDPDILKVWESAVFNEPIIILGATPRIASKTVRALVTLLGPLASPVWLPYIALTDPRFQLLMEKPVGIIGVSNPIIPSLMKEKVTVLRVGFPNLRRHSMCAPESKRVTENFHLAQNSENLILAIRAVHQTPRRNSGPPDLGTVKQKLLSKGVRTSQKMDTFVAKLVGAPLFESLRNNYPIYR
jgi:hypothetical protein